MSARRFVLFVAVVLGLAGVAGVATSDERFARLGEPGVFAIMRHALAPGGGDPDSFDLADCATQRNLDAAGRQQARDIGAAIRAAGVEVNRVYTSQWCRCRETAELLGLGAVIDEPALNSFFRDRSRAAAQTAVVENLLRTLPRNASAVLVTHQVNITALTDVFPASGEVLLLRVGEDGVIEVIDQVLIDP